MEKAYLGDAVYADFDEFHKHIVLTVEDGARTTDTIYLEPEVQVALVQFIEKLVGNGYGATHK